MKEHGPEMSIGGPQTAGHSLTAAGWSSMRWYSLANGSAAPVCHLRREAERGRARQSCRQRHVKSAVSLVGRPTKATADQVIRRRRID